MGNKKRIIAAVLVVLAVMMVGCARQADGWKQDGGDWFFYQAKTAQTGWLRSEGHWFFLDRETGAMQTGWLQDGNDTYYLKANGSMVTGWNKLDDAWHFFAPTGKMHTGWLKSNGNWYFLGAEGKLRTGWQQDGGHAYYFDSTGAMCTGWLRTGSGWYYLSSAGEVQTGWQKVEGKEYYFGADGKMLTNATMDGKKIGADGVAVTAPVVAKKPLDGIVIGLDPGHQGKGNPAKEPMAPGSQVMKAKVTSGGTGVSSRVPEHVIALNVGLQLRDMLEAQGATVVMSRTTADIDISNAQRAQKFNEAGCNLVIRLHCDGADNQAVQGVSMLVPTGQYTKAIEAESLKAGQVVLAEFVKATGANDRGISKRDDQTGFNWSTVPVINIEMAFLSNAEEDKKMQTESYRSLCCTGITNGVLQYFTP